MEFHSVAYVVEGRRALITLNRPERMNAIDRHMPGEIARAVAMANEDNDVHVIVLTGAGAGFCGGYDLVEFAERRPGPRPDGAPPRPDRANGEPLPWDPMADSRPCQSKRVVLTGARPAPINSSSVGH